MSIKEIKNLPANLSKTLKESDRDKVYADFMEALEKKIEVFEFEGDYNFKTLSQKAKEVARRKVFYPIYHDVEKRVEEVLSKEFPNEKWLKAVDYHYYEDKFCKIKNDLKQADRIHVYVYIDYRFIDNLYDTVLYDTRLHYKRKENSYEYDK